MDDITKPKLSPASQPRPISAVRPRRVSIPVTGHPASTLKPKPIAPKPMGEPTPLPQEPAAPQPAPAVEPLETEVDELVPTPKAPDSIMSKAAELSHEEPTNVGQVSQAPTGPRPKRSSLASILVALVIALALVGGAGYAYLQNDKETAKKASPATTTTTNKTEDISKKAATSTDVQSASDSIDKTIGGVNDSDGAAASDLSNTTLGL